jgi:hypothetical protein
MLRSQQRGGERRDPHLAACGKAHDTFAAAYLHGLVLRLPLISVATGGNELITLQTQMIALLEQSSQTVHTPCSTSAEALYHD